MIKTERKFVRPIGEVSIGVPCIILLSTGQQAKTSPVEDYSYNLLDGSWVIKTRNSIYRT